MSSSSSSTLFVLYDAAKETLVEFVQKTSLNGFGLLYYIRRRKYQRIFWLMFIVMGILASIYICSTIMISFLQEPTVTALDTQQHTIWDIPFPTVAVCSNNKLSLNAMRTLAQNLSKTDPTLHSPTQWLVKLKLFAGYFNTDSIDFDQALVLQNRLDSLTEESTFNTAKILKELAPKCEEFLVKCFWAGRPIDCIKQLKLVAFQRGHCCVFNYHYERLKTHDFFYPNGTGNQMGLTLVLNASTSDYFYAEGSSNGFSILLFGDQPVPHTSTGHLGEFHVDAGDDVEIKVQVLSQVSTPEARNHPVARRNCYVPNEHKEASYGSSACFLNCKIRSMENLCDCIPFYASYFESEANETLAQCTLAQCECLERYRITWQTYNPTNVNMNAHLKAELLDSLTCPECMPLCSFHKYQARKTVNNLRDSFRHRDNRIYLESIPNYSPDLCLVKIYPLSKYTIRYQMNVLYNWYQILSNIGGVIGICMGCSIISGYEIIYFGIVRLYENYRKLKATRR